MRVAVAIALMLAACGDESSGRTVARAVPEHAPLAGGTLVTLEGTGFDAADRVLVGGREVAFLDVHSATQMDIIVPPGERSGPVEIVVFGVTGSVTTREVLRYSETPVLTSATPSVIVASGELVTITVRGAGFRDEGAGRPTVIIGDDTVLDITVVDDTTLTVLAAHGRAFTRPAIEVINARGRAVLPRAVRYVPSTEPGLLLFPRSDDFALYYDPVRRQVTPIPAVGGAVPRFTTVVRAPDGEYWGVDTGGSYGHIDLDSQTFTPVIPFGMRFPALVRFGGELFGITRFFGSGPVIGRLDVDTAAFTPLTAALPCCGGFGLATDGTTVWFTSRHDVGFAINTVDLTTGTRGTPVPIGNSLGHHVEELRWFAGVLYATTQDGRLITIDPTTGAITELIGQQQPRWSAMEVFD